MGYMTVFAMLLGLASPSVAQTKLQIMTIYKTPTCGCCQKWADYIEKAGFIVDVKELADLSQIKKKYKIPSRAHSCHTGIINGYFVEGHVPVEDVRRMLKEKAKIAGIAVANMPIGSPGMEFGDRKDPYDVIAVDKNGKVSVFNSYNKSNIGK